MPIGGVILASGLFRRVCWCMHDRDASLDRLICVRLVERKSECLLPNTAFPFGHARQINWCQGKKSISWTLGLHTSPPDLTRLPFRKCYSFWKFRRGFGHTCNIYKRDQNDEFHKSPLPCIHAPPSYVWIIWPPQDQKDSLMEGVGGLFTIRKAISQGHCGTRYYDVDSEGVLIQRDGWSNSKAIQI